MCIWITKTRLHSGTLPFSLSVFSYTLGLGLPLYSGLLSAKPHTLPCGLQLHTHNPSLRRQSSHPHLDLSFERLRDIPYDISPSVLSLPPRLSVSFTRDFSSYYRHYIV